MSTPFDWHRAAGRRVFRAAVVFLSLGASGAMFSASAAAPQPATNPPASAEERTNLRQALESRYEVLPVQGGIVLKPRQPKAGIRTVEVTPDGVAVNGERVTPRTLHDWLGADADLVLRLQGLSAAEQRQVFGLEGGAPAASAPAAAPATPPAPPAAAPAAEPGDANGESEVSDEPAAAETPEAADTSRRHGDRHGSGSRVNVGGSVTVNKDEVAQDVVAIGGSATVDGEVEEGVTAIGGPARIDGKVAGEVVSVGSSVYLGPNAEVEGDVTSIGGMVHREPGSKVQGRINEVGILPFGRHVHFGPFGRHDWEPWGGVSRVLSSILFTVLLSLLVCLVLLVAREPLERVDRQLATRPWPSALAGFAFWPLALAVSLLLVITIVGCLVFVLYPFLFLFVGLLLLLGYSTSAYRLGRWVEGRFGRNFGSPYGAALVGVLLIQVWSIFAHMLGVLPGPLGFFASMIGLFGFLVQLLAWMVGFGATLLARFGLEPGYWQGQGPPPAPPSSSYQPPVEPLPLSGSEPPLEV